MATKLEAFTAQQMLIDAVPEAYHVTIINRADGFKIKLASAKDDTRHMLFDVEKVAELLSQPNADEVLASKIYDFEERAVKQLLELLKFKRVGKHYERQGSELKVWIFNYLPKTYGAPRPPGKFFVTDMYQTTRREAANATELLDILASGAFV